MTKNPLWSSLAERQQQGFNQLVDVFRIFASLLQEEPLESENLRHCLADTPKECALFFGDFLAAIQRLINYVLILYLPYRRLSTISCAVSRR